MSFERDQINLPAVACATAVANSDPIPMADCAGGIIILPASLGGATLLSFYVAGGVVGRQTAAGAKTGVAYSPVYRQLYSDLNAAITRTPTASTAIRIPLEAFGAGSLKIVSDVALTVEISLKS